MKKLFAALTVLLALVSLHAGHPAYMIPLDCDLYTYVDTLYSLQGLSAPSPSRPWSASEASYIVSRLDGGQMADREKELLALVEEELRSLETKWTDEDYGIGGGIAFFPEVYAHTNTKDFRNETSWAYDYNDRRKALEAYLDMSLADYFYSYCSVQYTLGRYTLAGGGTFYDPDVDYPHGLGTAVPEDERTGTKIPNEVQWYSSPFTFNFPSASKYFEFEWPQRAFVSLGGEGWNIFYGRDRINWGLGHSGNLILDDHVGYHDLLRAKGWGKRFSYEWDAVFLDTNPTQGESHDLGKTRMYLLHRLDFRPLDNFSFAVSENVMYQSSVLSLQYLNPGMIYHNLNNRAMFNAILHVEFSCVPVKGLTLYGQFALDQATAPNEDDVQDAAWGWFLGGEYTAGAGKGFFSADAEFTMTSPALYRRDGVDFLMEQREFTLGGHYPIRPYYIGYKYGGDVINCHGDVAYMIPGKAKVGFSVDYMTKGSMHMSTPHSTSPDHPNDEYPKLGLKTPSGEVSRYLVLATKGEWTLGGWKGIEASVYGGVWSVSAWEGKFRSDIQCSFGIGAKW